MTNYLLRLDDICPTMRRATFRAVIDVCRANKVTGILGVVPDNQDRSLQIEDEDPLFWKTIRTLAEEGWIIAQHGHQHTYKTQEPGLLRLRARSEVAGLPKNIQYEKIAAGKRILEERLGQDIRWWMAPAHSFDETTCSVLRELGFTHITDGIALYPYQAYGLTWIPHQIWKPERKLFGIWTLGLHLNTISDGYLQQTLSFIERHAAEMKQIDFSPRTHVLNPLFRLYWYTKFNILKQVT